jgi:hypothetical protein
VELGHYPVLETILIGFLFAAFVALLADNSSQATDL